MTSAVLLHPGHTGSPAVNALGGLAVLLTDNVLASHGVPVSDVHYVPVPFPAMDAARREAFALLDERRSPDGSIPRTMLFACTSGRKDRP